MLADLSIGDSISVQVLYRQSGRDLLEESPIGIFPLSNEMTGIPEGMEVTCSFSDAFCQNPEHGYQGDDDEKSRDHDGEREGQPEEVPPTEKGEPLLPAERNDLTVGQELRVCRIPWYDYHWIICSYWYGSTVHYCVLSHAIYS